MRAANSPSGSSRRGIPSSPRPRRRCSRSASGTSTQRRPRTPPKWGPSKGSSRRTCVRSNPPRCGSQNPTSFAARYPLSRAAVRSYRTSGLRRRSKSLTLHFAQMPEPDTTPMSLLSLQKSPESLTPLFSHICHSPILPLYHPLYITPCISPPVYHPLYIIAILQFPGRWVPAHPLI